MRSYLGAASLLAFVSFAPVASGQEPKAASESDLAETGRKLSNPLSDVWALFARFELNFADGDVNSGDSQIGSRMIFQPILPVPLYGKGANKWNLITRPTIPVLFSAVGSDGSQHLRPQGGAGGHPVADRDRAADREVDPRRGSRLPVPNRHRRCVRSQPVGRRSGPGRGLP